MLTMAKRAVDLDIYEKNLFCKRNQISLKKIGRSPYYPKNFGCMRQNHLIFLIII
ncbi:hypothetical protein PAJ34TS1_29780 [Paenibacillus azoreducens]